MRAKAPRETWTAQRGLREVQLCGNMAVLQTALEQTMQLREALQKDKSRASACGLLPREAWRGSFIVANASEGLSGAAKGPKVGESKR